MIDTDKTGGRNPLVDNAWQLQIVPDRLTPEEEELNRMRGPMVAANAQDDPRLMPVAADPDKGVEAANPVGSYEAFMASFGAKMVQPQE